MERIDVTLLLLGSLLVFATGCETFPPPLRVTPDGGVVMVDVMTLGEYPTTIRTIRLVDTTSSMTIWELDAATKAPQIWNFSLRAGENSVFADEPLIRDALSEGVYRIVMPKQAQTFWLETDRTYAVQVCGEIDWWCPKRTFKITE